MRTGYEELVENASRDKKEVVYVELSSLGVKHYQSHRAPLVWMICVHAVGILSVKPNELVIPSKRVQTSVLSKKSSARLIVHTQPRH